MPVHTTERVRHNSRRRKITVAAVEQLTPRMLRVHFTSAELHDFNSPSPDDHIKLFLPHPAATFGQRDEEVKRDFTPRLFEPEAGKLAVDFALHESGPATEWARLAGIGDVIEMGGPRGSFIVEDDFDWYLLVGDEAALPSIGRRLEHLRPDVPVTTIIVVHDTQEQQIFSTSAKWDPIWIFRGHGVATTRESLKLALESLTLPAGDGFIWVAAENSMARLAYLHFTETRQHPKQWIKAAGYWEAGKAEGGEHFG